MLQNLCDLLGQEPAVPVPRVARGALACLQCILMKPPGPNTLPGVPPPEDQSICRGVIMDRLVMELLLTFTVRFAAVEPQSDLEWVAASPAMDVFR